MCMKSARPILTSFGMRSLPGCRSAPELAPERASSVLNPFSTAPRWRVHLCFGPNCSSRGSQALMPLLQQAIAEAGIESEVEVIASTCRNRCDYGPSMNVYSGPTFYNELTAEAIEEIVREH